MADGVTLNAVGDLFVDRDDPAPALDQVAALLAAADLRFGNCEAAYSSTTERLPGSAGLYVTSPECFEAVRRGNFDVVSLANNHALDGGYSGLADTMALLHEAGVQTTGGGANLEEARRPAFARVGDLTVGFLSYTCVFPPGVGAAGARPGLATLAVHTVYRGEVGQPGTRPVVLTFLDPAAKASVVGDVEQAREQADFVVVSVHWGIHLLPAELADYERELGRAVIDAGADVVLGHHQHILKGIELYRGKPIVYGLGNFLIDHRHTHDIKAHETTNVFGGFYGEYGGAFRPETPTFPFHPESRQTMIARVRFVVGQDPELTLLPCMIDSTSSPAPIVAASPEFDAFLAYMAEITVRAGLNARFLARDGTIAVGA